MQQAETYFSPRTLKVFSICATASAGTTFLLWLLPKFYTVPGTIDAAAQLCRNPYYMGRLWVNFIHIFLALPAYGGATILLWRRSPALATAGFLFFFIWGMVELLGVSINLFAVNLTWRAELLVATEQKERIQNLIFGFQGIWNGLFFLLLTAFFLGTTFLGLAAVKGHRLERLVGILLLLACPLTLAIMIGGYTSLTVFDRWVELAYPVLQPVSRFILSLWLWRGPRFSHPVNLKAPNMLE